MHEFKLRDQPWNAIDVEAALQCRRLMLVIMQGLLGEGLEVTAGLNISELLGKKGTFILRSCEPVKRVKHIALAPLSTDMLAVIDMAPSEVNSVRRAIKQHYPSGVQSEVHTCLPHSRALFSTTFKLGGNPWGHDDSRTDENALARLTLCSALHRLLLFGYRCVCTADLSGTIGVIGGSLHQMSMDTLFFVMQAVNDTADHSLDYHQVNGEETTQGLMPAPSFATSSAENESVSAPPSYESALACSTAFDHVVECAPPSYLDAVNCGLHVV